MRLPPSNVPWADSSPSSTNCIKQRNDEKDAKDGGTDSLQSKTNHLHGIGNHQSQDKFEVLIGKENPLAKSNICCHKSMVVGRVL